MPTTFTSNVFSSTYKDDYDSSDNFHRILFNSGRALQARELTQMQTIIQEEIARLGSNLFTDGASVNPGGPSITNDYPFVKLETTPTDGPSLVGVELTGAVSTVKARVLEYVAPTSTDPATIYVRYTNTSGGSSGINPITFNSGEALTGAGVSVQSTDIPLINPAMGFGCKVFNDAGDFFVRGHFVRANAQGLIVSKYTKSPTATVGFKIIEDIVTVDDDTSLYDNQGSTPNITAPGADRYRIRMTLTTQTLVDSDISAGTTTNFMYYCRIVDGRIVDQVKGTDNYNRINDLLATRTKEESGNYIAKNFRASASQNTANTKTLLNISSGVAYVNGYRADNEVAKILEVDKPRDLSAVQNNETTGIRYGQYFICNLLLGKLDISTFETVNLRSAITHGGSTIGTARVRYVEEDGALFKVYLFDIKMNSGSVLRDVKSIGTSTIKYADIQLELGKAIIKESSRINMVFPLRHPRPELITDANFEVQRIVTGSTNGSGAVNIGGLGTGETYVNPTQAIVTRDDTGAVITPTIAVATDGSTLNITGAVASKALSVYAKVNISNATSRSKTLTSTLTFSGGVESDGTAASPTGTKFLNLHATDIHEVSVIKDGTSSGEDISARFTVDNGQRVSHYDNGRLVLNEGASVPSGDVYVEYKHFTHGTGDFFSRESYRGQLNYEDIPDFKVDNRNTVNLRDVIDLRPAVDSDGNFPTASINELPNSGDNFISDNTYYLRRTDKVVINTQGAVEAITGVSGFNSPVPPTPEDTLSLFEVEHNPYGLKPKDVVIRPVEARRFTMKDISKLEKRVERVEEATSLSLLELSADSLLVLDSDGRPRSKSGFFVDNFRHRKLSDAQNPMYRAAINPAKGVLQPQQIEDNVLLRYDSDKSSNTIIRGDTVYLNYEHVVAISQTQVTGALNVNPFGVITGIGNIELSPQGDEWIDTISLPDVVIQETATETVDDPIYVNIHPFHPGTSNFMNIPNGTIVNYYYGMGLCGTAMFNHYGTVTQTPGFDEIVKKDPDAPTGFSVVNQVVGPEVIREVIGTTEVSRILITKIRSRLVSFRARGLRPNTQYFPFFAQQSVSVFCREETGFKSSSTNIEMEKNQKPSPTAVHPTGSTDLITDEDGEILGSFFIPNNDTTSFETGEVEFALLDISNYDIENSTSLARINYIARGEEVTLENTVKETRVEQVREVIYNEFIQVQGQDPLAQTFRVTDASGMFLTKIDLFFKTRDDDNIPVQCQIRPVVNGVPSSTIIMGKGIQFVKRDSVALPAGQTAAQVIAAPTTFEFDEPIFLQPDTEFAIVLIAETTGYEAYVAETYQFELGSTAKKVNKQPAMGSLFKSQNGTTWSPDQTRDLMFILYKAEFDTAGGYAVFENGSIQPQPLIANSMFMSSGDATVSVLMPHHGFDSGDKVVITGLDSATKYNGVDGADIMGAKLITNFDEMGIQFEADSVASSGGRFGGTAVIADKQIQFDGFIPAITTLVPEKTRIKTSALFTTGTSLANKTGEQVRYQKSAITDLTAYKTDIRIRNENFFDVPQLVATDSNETLNIGAGEKSVTFKFDMTTTRKNVSPIIDAARASLTTLHNVCDNQASTTASGFNVPVDYVAETSSFGGSSIAKHITGVQYLEISAVGLKIVLSALRPEGSDFDLYYRVSNDGKSIYETDWTLHAAEQVVAPDAKSFREYRYLIGGVTGTLEAFTQYQIKLVMRTNNTSRIPKFQDLRTIALAV